MKIDISDVSNKLKNWEELGLKHLYKFLHFIEYQENATVRDSYGILTNIPADQISKIDRPKFEKHDTPRDKLDKYMNAVKEKHPEAIWLSLDGCSLLLDYQILEVEK